MEAPPTGSGLSVHPGFWMGTGGGSRGPPNQKWTPSCPTVCSQQPSCPWGGASGPGWGDQKRVGRGGSGDPRTYCVPPEFRFWGKFCRSEVTEA